MALVINLQDAFTRVATEIKSIRTLVNGNVADLSSLSTAAKSNLVAAINEINAAVASASGIDDTTTSTTTSWSSSKTNTEIDAAVTALVNSSPATLDTLAEIASALGDDPDFATTITTALGNRVRYDAAQVLDGAQQAQARSNIGAGTSSVAIGTVSGTAADAQAVSDALAGKAPTVHTHTASEISDATAIGRTILTAANAAAVLTAIGAVAAADVGDTSTDFVATFTAALV